MHPVRIAPSILAADSSELRGEVESVERAGCDWLHLDVMDGHFVPNLTFGPGVVGAVKRHATRPLDTHSMITDPWRYADAFIDAGSDWLTFHVEVEGDGDIGGLLRHIRSRGCKAGLSVQPNTSIAKLEPYLDQLDLVLIMSVHAGFGGQSFMPEVLPKAGALRKLGFGGEISMDGGIRLETIAAAAAAGVNVFVAGTAVFGTQDRAASIRELRQVATKEGFGGEGGPASR